MVGGILECAKMMPSLHVAQFVAEMINFEGFFELRAFRATLANEAITTFVEQESVEMHSSLIFMA